MLLFAVPLAIYGDIVRRRKDPGLLELVGRGLFRARVFPIEPSGETRIRLTYEQVLPERDGAVEFRYPLRTDGVDRSPRDVLVDVSFESTAGDLKTVFSPTHQVAVQRTGPRRARVHHEQAAATADRDLAVYFGRARNDVGLAVVSGRPKDGPGTFLVAIGAHVAGTPAAVVSKDVVYVLDVSGSMKGKKLAQAKAALKRGIALLRRGDRFNVVAFASDRQTFRSALTAASDTAKAAATAWVDAREAAGGTALADALLAAVGGGDPTRLFMVALLTDGKPTVGERNRDAIVAALRATGTTARVFTFGLGHDLDVALLDRVAEATGGRREYLAPHEAVDAAVTEFFRTIDAPVLTDLTLDAGPDAEQIYPRRLPDLFAGGQVVLLGRYRHAGRRRLTLRGRRGGTEVTFVSTVLFEESRAAPGLERLWAYRKAAFLADQVRLHGPTAEVRAEIVALATRYSVVTPYTAGLVVEPGGRGRRLPAGGVPPGVRQPSDPEPPPTPGEPLTFRSNDLRDRKERVAAAEERGVRTVADKIFRRDGDRWVDTAWDGAGEPERIVAFSEAYFALIASGDRVARYLSVGTRVVLVLDETVYEIVPGN